MDQNHQLNAALAFLQRIANGSEADPQAAAKAFLAHVEHPSRALLSDDANNLLTEFRHYGISTDTLSCIGREMQVQQAKFGNDHIMQQSLPGHLLILRHLIERAEKSWISGGFDRDSASGDLVKLAAVSLHAVNNEVRKADQVLQEKQQITLPV